MTCLGIGPMYLFHLAPQNGSENQGDGGSGLTMSASASIQIKRRSVTQVAPESFVFDVDLSGFDTGGPSGSEYDPQFHELFYFWDFGDIYTYAAPENLDARFKRADIAYGKTASHTYRQADTYTVSVLVVEPVSGKYAQDTVTVSVGDPETLFAGANTLFVSPSSDWSSAPTNAGLYTSVNAATAAIKGTDTVPKRIMLNQAEAHSWSGDSLGSQAARRIPSLHVVASPGGKAQVTMTNTVYWDDTATTGSGQDKDLVVQNLEFQGPWNATNETGAVLNCFHISDNSPNLFLVEGCRFDGFGLNIYMPQNTTVDHRALVMNDTAITNWQDYGCLIVRAAHVVLTGCRISQKIDANTGGPKTNPRSRNNHGPFRLALGKNLIVSGCDFFSRTGWFPDRAYFSPQPCLRLNVSGGTGLFVNIQASSFEGGYEQIAVVTQGNAGSDPQPVNAVIEKNYLVAAQQSSRCIGITMGGVTVRNNVMVFPASFHFTLNPSAFVNIFEDGGPSVNFTTPIQVYNNSFVNLMAPENFYNSNVSALLGVQTHSAFQAVMQGNNLLYQPNISSPQIADGPLETTPILWAPRNIGYTNAGQPVIAGTRTPASTVASYAPSVGAGALGAADETSKTPYDDFYGFIRPQYPSRGALEIL